MARTRVPAPGTGGHSSEANREDGNEDPRGVLLSVERLVLAAGDSVRRLRRLRSVSRLDPGWADDESLGQMVAQLDDVRGRLVALRDQVRHPDRQRPGPRGSQLSRRPRPEG